MSKVYLLLIRLLLAPFTGCIEDSALEPTEKIDETDNTEEKTEDQSTEVSLDEIKEEEASISEQEDTDSTNS